METEQLKMILEAVSAASDTGAHLFIMWLIVSKIGGIVGWLATVAMASWTILRILSRTVDSDKALRELRDALRIGSPGELTSSERRAVVAEVNKLIRFEKENRK